MKTFILFIFLVYCFNLQAQKKDTLFVLLERETFKNSINDSLIYDNSVNNYIYKYMIGKVKLPNEDKPNKSPHCGVDLQRDTIFFGRNIIKNLFEIRKTIFPISHSGNLKKYVSVLNNCDSTYSQSETSQKLKCYNKYRTFIRISPIQFIHYIIPKEAKKDLSKIEEMKGKKDEYINSITYNPPTPNGRIYKTINQIKKNLKYKDDESKNISGNYITRINSFNQELEMLLFDKSQNSNLIIFINEEEIPEYDENGNYDKPILFWEYTFNSLYDF